MPSLGQTGLSSENIANRALSVAEATRTTGRCYEAVSRALRPLGVELSGEAAYQAKALLLEDPRFMPLSINNVDQLRRGDIVVYTRSSSHPYGHISVYEGHYQEASDHLAPITHTQAYGTATVFRLRADNLEPAATIAVAPDFARPYAAAPVRQSPLEPAPAVPPAPEQAVRHRFFRNVVSAIRRDYSRIAGEPLERSLTRECVRFLLR